VLYLLAFFLSPLALLFGGAPFQAILNLFIYVAAWIGLFFGVVPGVILWAIGAAHAIFTIHNKRANARARMIVDAIRSNRL
jgi:hypothetical protein